MAPYKKRPENFPKKPLTNEKIYDIINAITENAKMRNSMQIPSPFREMPVGARHRNKFAELTVEQLT